MYSSSTVSGIAFRVMAFQIINAAINAQAYRSDGFTERYIKD